MNPTVKVTTSKMDTSDNNRPVQEDFSQQSVNEFKKSTFPTNVVPLPSKGLLYSEDDPLSQGYVEMKFMTAKEENILTTESYIKAGLVVEKFLQSMIVSPKFNHDNLLIGDQNALLIASRIYGYGEQYNIEVTTPSGKKQKVEINLEELPHKEFDEAAITKHENRFTYSFDNRIGKYDIEFKLLTVGDQKEIDQKLKKVKSSSASDKQVTTRLEQMILSVNGNSDRNFIRLFIENEFLAADSRKFREHVGSLQPGVNMEVEIFDEETGDSFRSQVTLGSNLLWPDL
jgi:hypothetical protein